MRTKSGLIEFCLRFFIRGDILSPPSNPLLILVHAMREHRSIPLPLRKTAPDRRGVSKPSVKARGPSRGFLSAEAPACAPSRPLVYAEGHRSPRCVVEYSCHGEGRATADPPSTRGHYSELPIFS